MVVELGEKPKNMREGTEKYGGKKILKIVSKILDFNLNERKQRRQGLKMLTPNQMLSRLPILLAQLKAGNNFEKLKMKSDNYYIDQKSFQKVSIKVWLMLFKNGNNFYGYQKQ